MAARAGSFVKIGILAACYSLRVKFFLDEVRAGAANGAAPETARSRGVGGLWFDDGPACVGFCGGKEDGNPPMPFAGKGAKGLERRGRYRQPLLTRIIHAFDSRESKEGGGKLYFCTATAS